MQGAVQTQSERWVLAHKASQQLLGLSFLAETQGFGIKEVRQTVFYCSNQPANPGRGCNLSKLRSAEKWLYSTRVLSKAEQSEQ